MTTPDSKYKHKPSEKHTLEEVLKSLQDLIRNDLPEADQSAASVEAPHATSTPPKEKPGHESDLLAREDFAPTNPTAGPVNLDAVMRSLKDLIGNELNVADELAPTETAPETPASEPQTATDSPSEEFLSLDEELNPEKPEDVTIGTSPAATEESIAPPMEQPVAKKTGSEEFISLDEELTLGASTEIIPPRTAVSTIPGLPEQISPARIGKPEDTAPPEASQPEPGNRIVGGTQQELLLEEPPSSAFQHKPVIMHIAPARNLAPDTAPASTSSAPEIVNEPPAQDTNKIAEDILPTIEVEETFDTGGYFEMVSPQVEVSPSEAQDVQEIIGTALDTSLASEKHAPAPTSSIGETQSNDLTLAPTPETAPADGVIKLEILEEPASETARNTASVDFDTIDVELPYQERGPSTLTNETPAPADETTPGAPASPATPGTTSEFDKPALAPPTPEVKAETKPESRTGAVPDSKVLPPAPGETHKMAGQAVPTESKSAFHLDDIPVLNEVVAPPAGSTLVVDPAATSAGLALPAQERARDIVVHAVAKLNVEMRKTGGAGLDTKTIIRLQQLIRQELEKNGNKSQK